MADEGVGAVDNQGGQGSSDAGGGSGSILNPEGGQQAGQAGTQSDAVDWRSDESVPEIYRTDKVFDNIKANTLKEAMPILLKNYSEAQKYIGGAVRIPKPTDPQEKHDELFNKLGRPESADKYAYNMPEIGKSAWDNEGLKDFSGTAHKLGLTNAQFQGVLDWYGGYVNKTTTNYENNQKQAIAKLREEWGGNFERKAVLAQRAAKEFGGPGIMKLLDKTGFGNNPDFIKFFSAIGEILAEDGLISGHVQGIPGPAEAKEQIAKIMADPNDLYHSKFEGQPGHSERVKSVQKLFQLAYGE